MFFLLGNYWSVSIADIPEEHYRQQIRAVYRNLPSGCDFVSDLRKVFDFEKGEYKNSQSSMQRPENMLLKIDSSFGLLSPETSPEVSPLVQRKRKFIYEKPENFPIKRPFTPESATPSFATEALISEMPPPFSAEALVSLVYLSLGVHIARKEQLCDHFVQLFPFWKFYPQSVEAIIRKGCESSSRIFSPIFSHTSQMWAFDFKKINRNICWRTFENPIYTNNLYTVLCQNEHVFSKLTGEEIRRLLLQTESPESLENLTIC